MIQRPPGSTRTDTLFPDTTLFRSQKGGVVEQGGDWENARPALEKALELAPNAPIVLNYLGYASLEHGGDPVKALALVERASALEPDDPAITDSLAWAYFRLGDTAKALPLLQEAARKSPRSEEHTSELQSLMRISYAVFCLKKKKKKHKTAEQQP